MPFVFSLIYNYKEVKKMKEENETAYYNLILIQIAMPVGDGVAFKNKNTIFNAQKHLK